MKFTVTIFVTAVFCALCATAVTHAAGDSQSAVRSIVDGAIGPVMRKDAIPGMAVAVTVGGRAYVFNYGVASVKTGRPVTGTTLFELGSASKTLTATLASWAQIDGDLSLSDHTAKYFPDLRGTAFGEVTLLNLGTHTPGGLPLQVPDSVPDERGLIAYLKQWHPVYARNTYRTYSNIGIGVLGLIAAKSMGGNFTQLMQQRLFPALGMNSTYIDVPAAKMADYAWGYRDGAPVRLSPGVLWAQAYGVRSTAADMIRFVEANMNLVEVDSGLQRAIALTHTGYFKAGPLTQDLIWEQYPYPVALDTVVTGNSPQMIFRPVPATQITPPEQPVQSAWLNKTGSTNGFGTYVAFVPAKKLGIVILANKNYPLADRVTAAYEILTALDGAVKR